MLQRNLIRSGLQFVGLCIAAVFLASSPLQAEECPTSDFSCNERASDCAQQCGATVTWDYVYTAEHWWQDQYGIWWSDPHNVYNYSYSSGVQDFECDELTETSGCSCEY